MSEEKKGHEHHETHSHKSNDEKSITIKKSDLWKYSTFVLIAVVIIGAVFMFTGGGASAGNPTGTGDTGTGQPADVSVFEDLTSLFPYLGPENSNNVVIEFADFQCPHCAIASGLPSWTSQYSSYAHYNSAKNVEEAARNGDLKFVYVPMSFLGQESVYAAQAGYCAYEQDKFWEMHDAIFAASDSPSENTGKYSIDNLKKIAAGISGIDTAQFNDCLDSGKYASAVQQAAAYASTAAQGTPTFYVNGNQVTASWTAIQAALN